MLGILDSGVGGLSVWKELKNLSPKSGVLYFADNARVPYGNLTRDKIFIYSKESISHLIDLGATSVAIACHTISTTIGPLLKHSTKIPILDIASHSIPLLSRYNKIGVIGTKATIESGFYQRALNEKIVTALACPNLVTMIESGIIDEKVIEFSLNKIDPSIDALFLACTHFPLIKERIQKYFPHTPIIDPANSFAVNLLQYICDSADEFYTTKDPAGFHKSTSIFCGEKKVAFPILVKSLYSPLIS